MTLYHFTCRDAAARIDQTGFLIPARVRDDVPHEHLPWTSAFIWLTDLPSLTAQHHKAALGMANLQGRLTCDRTEVRFRVTDESMVMPWVRAVRAYNLGALRRDAEGYPGARPMHWFVSIEQVPVVRDDV